jgi:hypothetical protein
MLCSGGILGMRMLQLRPPEVRQASLSEVIVGLARPDAGSWLRLSQRARWPSLALSWVLCLAAAHPARGWLEGRRVFSVHPRPCASSTRLKKRHRRFPELPPVAVEPRIPRHQFLTLLLQARSQTSTRYRYVSPAEPRLTC